MDDAVRLNYVADPSLIEPSERAERFPSAPPSVATRDDEAVLHLVNQAAEVIKGLEDHTRKAVEELKQAEKRVQELEAERRAAEACVSGAQVKINEATEALKLERSRVEAAENRICDIEARARVAEARARELGDLLVRVEEAIRTQILAKKVV